MHANERGTEIHFFSKITPDTHPAIPYILTWLDAQVQKDYKTFAASFGSTLNSHLFVNLPGGRIVTDAEQLLLRHKNFYENPLFQIKRGELSNGMGNRDFFTCSVLVQVTLPDGTQRKKLYRHDVLKTERLKPNLGPHADYQYSR